MTSNKAIEKIENVIDKKIMKAFDSMAGSLKRYSGVVTRVDSDGTIWVQPNGSGESIPCTNSGTTAKKNDIVTWRYSDGRIFIEDNPSDPAASSHDLQNNYAHITKGIIDNAYIDQANVNNLDANFAHITNGVIDNAYIDQANVNNLSANFAHITNGVIDNATIGYANVNNLDAHFAHITNGVIDNAKIGYADVNNLDAHYAEIDLANVNNAWIQNGTIKDAAIGDAQILGVSANKITVGTLDASKVNVANLRAKNLIVEKLNGQPVLGGYETVNPNSSGYSSKNPSQEGWYEFANGTFVASTDTAVDESKVYYKDSEQVALYDQTYIDGLENQLNQRIDGAVETFTGTVVPTMVNYPVSDWSASEYDSHVGDIYYVVNAGAQADGYSYRFTKFGTGSAATYGWTLIKDTDITKALQDILDINGALDIDSIIASDYTVYSFMEHTDGELSNLQVAQSTLETALGTKVDTTTFNTVAQTVSENSASITTMSETINSMEPIVSAEGERTLTTENAAELPLLTLTAYGESVQNGTPTPDASVRIKSVRNGNLATRAYLQSTTYGGATCVDNDSYTGGYLITIPASSYESGTNNYETKDLDDLLFDSDLGDNLSISFNAWTDGTVNNLSNDMYPDSYGGAGGGDWGFALSTTPTRYTRRGVLANSQGLQPHTYFRFFRYNQSGNSTVYITDLTITFAAHDIHAYMPDGCIAVKCSNGSVAYVDLKGEQVDGLDSTYRDTLTIDASGHAVIHKRTGRITADDFGSTLQTVGSYKAATASLQSADMMHSGNNEVLLAKSNYFMPVKWNTSWAPGKIFREQTSSTVYFTFESSFASTVDELKSKIPSFECIYPLNEAYWHDIDLGYVELPTLSDDASVYVIAEVQPVVNGSWWTNYASETGAASHSMSQTVNSVRQTTDSNSAHISNLTSTLGVNDDGTSTSTLTHTYSQIDQGLTGLTSTVGKLEEQTSIRFVLRRDNWTEVQWGTNGTIGASLTFDNVHYDSSGNASVTGYKSNTLRIGDLVQVSGKATDTASGSSIGNPHQIVCKVTSVPSGEGSGIPTTVIAVDDMSGIATRISQTQSSITQTASSIVAAVQSSYSASGMSLADPMLWEQGTTNNETGKTYSQAKQDATNRVRTVSTFPIEPGKYMISISSDYRYGVLLFSANGIYVDWLSWRSSIEITIDSGIASIAILLSKSDSSAITPTDVVLAKFRITNTYASQAELALTNEAVNARVEKDGVIGAINLSSESATISADKVNIEGAAIFTTGRLSSSSLNTAYDANGAASTAEQNAKNYADAIEIGGRNLFPASCYDTAYKVEVPDSVSGYGYTLPTSSSQYPTTACSSNLPTYDSFKQSEKYTVSFDAVATGTTKFQFDLYPDAFQPSSITFNVGNTKTRLSKTFELGLASGYSWPSYIQARFWRMPNDPNYAITISDIKLEKGTKATDWSPAPEDALNAIAAVQEYAEGIPGIKYLSTSYTNTMATIQGWSIEGGTYWFDVSDASGVRVGDTVYLKTVPSDNNSMPVYIVLTVTSINGNRLTGTTHGYVDTGATNFARNAAPKTDAVAATQRVYYRSYESGNVTGPGTTWVASQSNIWNDTTSVGFNGWSTKITPLANGVSGKKYIYLYTAIQKKTVNGSVTTSDILLDDSTTVIDGGNIATGSITANALKASDINVSNKLSVGAFTADDQKTLLGGGRNLISRKGLLYTTDFGSIAVTKSGWGIAFAPSSSTKITQLGYDTSKLVYGDTYTISFDAWLSDGSGATLVWDLYPDSYPVDQQYSLTTTRTHFSRSVKIYNGTGAFVANTMFRLFCTHGTTGYIYITDIKFEHGPNETEWTPAPEDLASTATNYITDITNSGITIHPSSGGSSPSANYLKLNGDGVYNYKDSTHFTHMASDGFHVYSGDASNDIAVLGTSLRIGKAAGPRVVIQSSGVDLFTRNTNDTADVNLAHFGYYQGNASSGTSWAPYYTLGTRSSGSAIGNYSVVLGYGSIASGPQCVAEGMTTIASGMYSHAEGNTTEASGIAAHAQNINTQALYYAQTAIGKYNDPKSDSYAFLVGNGSASARSNALALKWDGTLELSGDDATWITSGQIKYRKHHGIVYVVGNSGSGGTSVDTSGMQVALLPTGYRPSTLIVGSATTKAAQIGQYNIATDGKVTVWNFSTSSVYWGFAVSYPV